MQTEIEALQNAANNIGLTIHPYWREDKRKTIPLYFASRGMETVSPVLPYKELNAFLLGWIKSTK